MSIKIAQVNNERVSRIPIKLDTRKVKGKEISEECYNNIFMVAPTNSGKTTALFHILKRCAGKHTSIICFVSTLHNDPAWQAIRKYFDKKGIIFIAHTSITEESINHLGELVNHLKEQAEDRDDGEGDQSDEEEEVDPLELVATNGLQNWLEKDDDKPSKPKKSKYLAPDYILVFDDIAEEIRSAVYNELLKRSRHFRIKTITSSQYLKDLKPSSRMQIRLWLVFRGQSPDKLEEIYKALEPSISLELFLAMYKRATIPTKTSPKPFFYCSKAGDYRINFDRKFLVPTDVF